MTKMKFKSQEVRDLKSKLDARFKAEEIDKEVYDSELNELVEKDKELTKHNGSFFETIILYYKKEWKLSSILIFLTCLSVVSSIMLPLLTQQMTKAIMLEVSTNNGTPMPMSGYWGLEWWVSLIIAASVVFANIGVQFMTQYIGVILGKRIEIDLRNKSLEALIRQDISYYSDKKIGELLTKVVSDTQIVGDQAATIPSTVINTILTVTASVAMMFVFEWRITLGVVGAFVLILAAMGVAFFFSKKRIKKVREVVTEINGNVTDRINNVRLIKSTGTENYETQRFHDVHKEYYTEVRKMAKVQSAMVVILFGGISFMQLMVVALAMVFYHDSTNALTFFSTEFASFQMAQGTMVGSLFQLVMLTMGIASASVSSVRIKDTITAPSILDPHYFGEEKVDHISGDIEFKGVSFAYPEKPGKIIIPEFDFTFKEGKSYAFVGETGSGKSTIARLLLRFYDPTTGNILVNGNQNLKDVNLSSYLYNVGYVEQDPQILYGDVYDNVKYGRFDATNEEVIEACKKAELHDLIMSWPEGYDTILGERGFMLSGGQKQRMIIARMFLKDPQLLILDEATSALDNIVEKEIQAKLEDLMKGRTTVSIAHRLSTIKNADQIIVLGANGKGIVQTGTFDELKDKPGHFQKLYNAGLMD
ncbi:ABC transporter ATP-binding protein [[Acholeplasma] multilocale]|uniref:ABC transporter ATP-binding protein n=1 Tax=[Acholeplasma] multilocale TaxID=264638 RepID=UPI00244E22B6|nr:ABC transporter ATP-binding protein [[Acholeplasma] multilocale]